MAENKKSFVLYADYMESIEELSDDEAGKLLKHIFRYVNDLNPVCEDKLVKLTFIPIKNQLKRDLENWEIIKGKRSEAGKASAEAKRLAKLQEQTLTDSTSVESVEQNSTNSTVNVNDIVTEYVTVTDNDILLEKETKVFKFDFFKKMKDLGFEEKYVDEFKIIRKSKKAVNSELALTKILNEIEKSGIEKNECLKIICEKQWKGFEAEWLKNNSEKEKSSAQKEKEPELKIGRQTVAEC